MQNVYLLPAKDAAGNTLRVPDPFAGQALPAEGGWKPRNQYWLRRIRAGDVTEGEPPAIPAAKTASPQAAEPPTVPAAKPAAPKDAALDPPAAPVVVGP